MKTQDLVKLNLDELETELAKGSFSKSFLDSLLKAEKSDKSPRKGAIELIEGAIAALDDEQDLPTKPEVIDSHQSLVTSGESYAVAKGQSIGFRAGIKTGGDVVDLEWPEFKANKTLLDSMIERGLVVKQ
ncbi:hypothetical protein VPHPS15B6_0008 [Vibrio phage PS15B-6]|nr:hypothetical protein MYOV066v1_p0017 [Vibrio phage PS15B.3]QZI90917.1 hypothetical protein MYOV064v1_p0067 [Vibrio phage PS15B.4]